MALSLGRPVGFGYPEGEHLGDVRRPANVVALGVVYPVLPQQPHRLLIADKLRYRFLAQAPRYGHHRLQEVLVDLATGKIANEGPVDLQVVDGQLLEVVEGREASPEIVQGESAAQPL